jgi:outer membrane protein assembly complex protein YaeT
VKAASVKPLDVTLDWNGSGKAAERLEARIAAGESHVTLAAAIDADSARLTALEFARRGEAPLRLAGPATIRWQPKLQLTDFTLANEKSRIDATVAWGETGTINLALREVPSSWFADFTTLPGPSWTLSSVAVNASWDGGPMTFEAVASGTSPVRENHEVTANLHVRGDARGIELVGLRALDNGAPVISVSGLAPATITPGGSPALKVQPDGRVALKLTTTENKVFWDEIATMAGVTLEAPRVTANVEGTWREPRGTISGNVARVVFAPKEGRTLPPIEDVKLALSASHQGVVVEQFGALIENQRVQTSGRLPFPKDSWDDLRKDPLAFARRGAEVRFDLPTTDLSEFKNLLPAMVVPQGTIAANISLRDGALDGTFELRGAATRPIGSLGALHEIQAVVRFKGQDAYLESVTAELGGAPIRISGKVTLPPLGAERGLAANRAHVLPKFDVTVKAENIPLVRKIGTLVRADLDVALTSPSDAEPLVKGTVQLRNSLFLQDVRGLIPSGTRSKSERPPFFAVEIEPFSAWRLDVQVTGEEFLRLRTTMFNGTASADFRLGGTLGDPSLLGEATIDRGQIRLPFATFSVDEGRVSLTPAQPHEPDVFVTATTRRFEYDLRLEVSGDASSPTLTFESTPPLEHGQVLLMVMAGVVPNNAITVTQQQRATRLGSYLGQSLLSSFGDGDDTSRLTITSGEDISEQGRETYDIEYSLNRRWSLTAEYDEYDTHTLGVKWQALRRGGVALAGSGSESFDTSGNAGADTAAAGRSSEAADQAASTEFDRRGKKPKPAKIDVSGLGWFSSFEMEASLKRLVGGKQRVLNSHAIEDALFLLLSAVREKGYLRPTVRVHVINDDGTRHEFSIDAELTTPVPRDLAARVVEFHVTEGTHYFVDHFEATGLYAIDPETARAYFAGDPGLLKRQKAATFNPDRLKRGIASLEAALRERGYAEAEVTAAEPQIDHDTGKVSLAIAVLEGPRWQIGGVDIAGAVPGLSSTGSAEGVTRYIGEPWSEAVEQDIAAEVRRNHLQEGYADSRVRISHRAQPIDENHKLVQVAAEVTPGPRVVVGEIHFRGNVKTRDAVLVRRIPFRPGDPLNPLEIQHARRRLARLGVYDDVDVRLEPPEGGERDVVFEVKPGKQMELNLLGGYNTYEQLRAGLEIRRYNVWGRAHQTRGLLVQSMKSTRGEYTHTVPELFGEEVHGTARVFGLQREEVAFLRQEYGAALTVDTPLRFLDANLTAGYTFEVLRNSDNELETRAIDQSQVEVASVQAGLTRDRRDNPLLPRDGYRWFSRIEAASPMLGGEAEYQRLEFGGTYHYPWGTGRWLHFSAAHGVVTTLGRNDEKLPVNKRFFPGGDGSIRGYQLGEAAPRGDQGRFVGAKSYLSATAEFEQSLLAKWSGVLFVDALGSARRMAQYPFDEVLVSVGLGLRYQTLIGPIRAEYGHNLNPRDGDPGGTFLFSIGFPF